MQVEKLSGHELEDFLLSLEPEGWDRSAAVIDRPAASQVSVPLADGASMHAGRLALCACRRYIGLLSYDLSRNFCT